MKQPRGCSKGSFDSFAEFPHDDQFAFNQSLFPFSWNNRPNKTFNFFMIHHKTTNLLEDEI